MKKIKILLLFFLMIACGTIISVSGFYINENSKVVIDWFNGNIAVTNGDYKELVEETTVTIGYLEAKISNLETENVSLTSEKDSLTEQVQDLMLNAEENQEVIDLCLEQIDNLNSQLAENEVLIKDLKALIRSLSEKTIKSIIDLPEELNSKSLLLNWIGNNALVYWNQNGASVYYFDYNAGTLTYLTSGNVSGHSYIHSFEDGYIAGWENFGFAYRYSTGELVTGVPRASQKTCIVEYGNGCYVISPTYLTVSYFNYDTFESNLIYKSDVYVEQSCRYAQFGKDLFIECFYSANYNSKDNLYYLNCETGEFYQLFANSSSYVRIFELKGNYYILRSNIKEESGLYKIDLVNKTLELVYQLDDPTVQIFVNHFYSFENVVVFSTKTTLFSFDGETVSEIYQMSNWNLQSSLNLEQEIIYEDDEVCYSSAKYSRLILKYFKSTCEISVVYFDSSVFVQNYLVVPDKGILFTASALCVLDFATGEIIVLSSGGYSSVFTEYYDIGDSIYVLPYNSNGTYTIRIKKDGFIISSLGFRSYTEGDKLTVECKIGNKYIFSYTSGGCCIYDSVNNNSLTYNSDNSLSNFDERTIYIKVKDLEEGAVYYKYQYNEDFTEYTRSLVIVE